MLTEPSAPSRAQTYPLFELTRAVAAARRPEHIYDAALRCLAESLGVYRSSILLFDPDGVMRFKAWRDLSAGYREAAEGHSPWGPDVRDPQPVLIPDVASDLTLTGLRPAIEADGIRALAFVPLVIGDRLLGKFMLYYEAPHEFTDDELLVAGTIAAHVAFAIDQHLARAERQLQADLLAGQKRTLELLAAGSPLAEVLGSLSSLIGELSGGAALASIALVGADEGPEADLLPEAGTIAGIVGQLTPPAAVAGRVTITPDIATDAMWNGTGETAVSLGFRAAWTQPILASDGRVVGTFTTYFREQRGPTASERQVVEVLAGTAALAIESARAAEERRDQRDHLDAIFASTVAGIAEFDLDGRFRVVNARFCELAGRSREELLAGTDCFSVTHPDERERMRDRVARLIESGQPSILEKRYLLPGGSTVWVSSSISALRGPAGNVEGVVAVITDITARKRAEELLQRSQHTYKSLIEALNVAVYTTDHDGRITLYNSAAARLWGREPVLGEDRWCGSWRLFWPDGTPMSHDECPMGIALKEDREVRDREILVERPDGSRGTVMPHPTPLHDASGALVGAVNVLVDLTEQKRTQAALSDALRAKDDFLGQVSHELATPVTQIAGNAEILLRRWLDLPPQTQHESLEEMHGQALRLKRVVDNMMVLSRFGRGEVPPTEPQLLQRLLGKTVREFQQRFPHANVHANIDQLLPPVETNPTTIDQVVWNLLTNAHKYGRPRGVIELVARFRNGFVEVSVCDEGEGVPAADLPMLFEPYFRSPTAPEHAAGLGLGLSVCKQLVEAQKGEMWAARREGGRGMEFGLRLRALDDDALEA